MGPDNSRAASEASSSKLRLAVEPPAPPGYHLIGSELSGRATVSSVASFTSIELLSVVRSQASIMGKDRWQAAQALNGGGLAAVVMQREEHTIFREAQTLWPQRDGASAKKSSSSHASTVELSFTTTLPEYQPPCTCSDHPQPLLMPSSFKCGHESEEYSKMYIYWELSLVGHRSGLFNRAQKVTLDLPVAAPPASLPAYNELVMELRSPQAPLTFKGASHDLSMQAKIEFSDGGSPVARTPCDLSVTVSWWLVSLSGGPPPAESLLATIDVDVDLFLSRYAFTRPIDRPQDGQPFEWANQRESTGRIEGPLSSTGDGRRAVAGTIKVGEHCVTFKSCGAAMNYRVNARLASKMLTRSLTLHLPVTLTHAPPTRA